MHLYLSMGLKPSGRVAEPLAAVLRCVDWPAGAVIGDLSCASRSQHTSGPDADQECTAACWLPDGVLLQPTHTEVLWIHAESGRILRRSSHPLLHNVHSATPLPDGGYLVTCAGSDAEVADFRRLHHDALKPHAHHPNHALRVGEATWVTCFETQRALCLEDGRTVSFPEGIPHDGRLHEGLLWFTVVTGHVIAVDPHTLERRRHLDLNQLAGTGRMLGWCRGLDIVGRRLFVGMTVLRATHHREVLRWLARGDAGRKLPTRVLEIDLDRAAIVREVPVGNAAGGTIYAINARSP